jgi:adenosylcobinamide kinase/adenosylcobinamide-phosphate guanylyltransferase
MAEALSLARRELILGGQKSGKSRRAELLARTWLDGGSAHQAVLIATAQPWDAEMQARIARHQADRAARVPGMRTVEEPLALAKAIQDHSRPDTLLVVDCLTLWLTNWRMPMHPKVLPSSEPNLPLALVSIDYVALLLEAIAAAPGPLVLVGNEIGLGVIPMGVEVRAFVDALGLLNQQVAQRCERVTLMAAGLPLTLKAAD